MTRPAPTLTSRHVGFVTAMLMAGSGLALCGAFLACGRVVFLNSATYRVPVSLPVQMEAGERVASTFHPSAGGRYYVAVVVERSTDVDSIRKLTGLDIIEGTQAAVPGSMDVEWALTKDGVAVGEGSSLAHRGFGIYGREIARVIGVVDLEEGAGYELTVRVQKTVSGMSSIAPKIELVMSPHVYQPVLQWVVVYKSLFVCLTVLGCATALLAKRRIKPK